MTTYEEAQARSRPAALQLLELLVWAFIALAGLQVRLFVGLFNLPYALVKQGQFIWDSLTGAIVHQAAGEAPVRVRGDEIWTISRLIAFLPHVARTTRYPWSRGAAILERTERRARPTAAAGCTQLQGTVDIHPLDSTSLRRTMFGVWRFDELLDLDAMDRALDKAIAVHPILGGWADVQPDGQHVLRWDASAKRAGAVWVRAAARGPAPPFPTTPFDLHIRGLLPTLRPYSLIALQATHLPEANCTLVAATMNHVAGDISAFEAFLSAWSDACEAEIAAASAGTKSAFTRASPPWDRAPLQACWPGADKGTDMAAVGEPFDRDPYSRWTTFTGIARGIFFGIPEDVWQAWLLPKPAIEALKVTLAGSLPNGKAPTANDVLSGLLTASLARLEPERVAKRGGMTSWVVVNARGGRCGTEVPDDFFGNFSLAVPIWVPADVALAPAPKSADPEAALAVPSPELVRHIHLGLRATVLPPPEANGGIVRRQVQWLADATAAGRAGAVRLHELPDLCDGDVTIDNIANTRVDYRFGSTKEASAANFVFLPGPRFSCIHPAAGPLPGKAKGERGDLYLAVTLPAWQWAALGPALEALGGTRVRNNHSGDVLSSHPSIIRYGMSEVLRRPLPWL